MDELTIEHGNMKRTIDQAKDIVDLLSQKCKKCKNLKPSHRRIGG
jgi:ribosomal protein L32